MQICDARSAARARRATSLLELPCLSQKNANRGLIIAVDTLLCVFFCLGAWESGDDGGWVGRWVRGLCGWFLVCVGCLCVCVPTF